MAVKYESFSLWAWLRREREWSLETFGPRSTTKSITNHIRKELLEVEAHPNDLEEWIDIAMLAFDGAWRNGATSTDITRELDRKLNENMDRKWPAWRNKTDPDEPTEHIR
jgi:Protein of unknown function (DUF550)